MDLAELAGGDAVPDDLRHRVDQLRALVPVPGERLGVTAGETVDLVEVIGNDDKATTSARMIR